MPQLGVNIDHIATLRQARGGHVPSPRFAALEAQKGGADGITLHLREDRRHIQDKDLYAVKKAVHLPLNLEMALVPEIIDIALRLKPAKVCIVPEKRQELTTEGGLDVASRQSLLKRVIARLHRREIEISLFIEPVLEQIEAAFHVKADAIEFHTGTYANARGRKRRLQLTQLREAADEAVRYSLKVHAGHGLDYQNVKPVARIPEIKELNIGHSIVSRAVFVGMRRAVREMKALMT
ncbi:MAG TPA: pyridoxine 5'-phosphate synthase [bacterium]|nr:pyridoxine 5'-phosphate synthase [bacterium]